MKLTVDSIILSAANFSPHPLKQKSSRRRGWELSFDALFAMSEIGATSRAQVSLLSQVKSVTRFICSSVSLPFSKELTILYHVL